MPIYTYECEECGVRFDARQKFSDDPITLCPECGGNTHRVPQAVGIVFKGSGWYVTDSKGRNNLAVAPNTKEGGSDSGGEQKKAKADPAPPKDSTESKTSGD